MNTYTFKSLKSVLFLRIVPYISCDICLKIYIHEETVKQYNGVLFSTFKPISDFTGKTLWYRQNQN